MVQGRDRRRAAVMLLLDAIAPLIGAGLTLLSHVPDQDLLSYLGVRRLAPKPRLS